MFHERPSLLGSISAPPTPAAQTSLLFLQFLLLLVTGEGWPLLTVETEANWDSWSTLHMKEVLPWLVHWARRVRTIDFYPALDALVSLVRNIILLTGHFFTCLVPIAQQSCWVACLFVSAGDVDVAALAGNPAIAVSAVVVVPSVVLWAVC
jgi:hypothetical protein